MFKTKLVKPESNVITNRTKKKKKNPTNQQNNTSKTNCLGLSVEFKKEFWGLGVWFSGTGFA